jgi:hypothetical protein
MHDPGQKLHAIMIDIVYNIAYDFGKMGPQNAQVISVSPWKIGISPTIQWIRAGTQLASLSASVPLTPEVPHALQNVVEADWSPPLRHGLAGRSGAGPG